MLSYRHGFHAGNFADVLKHSVLSQIIEALKLKDKSFVYYDTHSGLGLYDLNDGFAEKNREYTSGILRLWEAKSPPDFFEPYLKVVRAFNPNVLTHYPGSPVIVQRLMRSQDKMILSELHSRDAPALAEWFAKDARVQVYHEDGFQGLHARLPPKSRRALIFIDPSYEIKNEYPLVVDAIKSAYQVFSTGIFCLWYPVIERAKTEALCMRLVDTGIRRILRVELCLAPDGLGRGMTGAGLLMINPPWQLDLKLAACLPWLQDCLAAVGGYRVQWLVGE